MENTKNEFLPGDIVQLKSGGPALTVVKIKDEMVVCAWFDKNDEANEDKFAAIALKKHTTGLK